MFQLRRTFSDPATSQAGFPSPGDGAQTTGDPTYASLDNGQTPWEARRPTQGFRTWLNTFLNGGQQRGYPEPEGPNQGRPNGSMPNSPAFSGLPQMVYTPYYSRGTAAFVPNYGKVLTNPIGSGVVAQSRPQASYGPAAVYENGALWWTSQIIPTSVNLQGLTDPDVLAAQLNSVEIQAVVRTTG